MLAATASALLAGVLFPSVIRLHLLLAISTHYAHLDASTPGATTAPNVPAEAWVEADAGLLGARVVHSKCEWI
ncbi:hypothetical protein FB451DRAFT_1410418 [Mycena latifolia]|nr:hypothetical protein FB451DRAFT_1410418 [Mycena latifolia]